MRRVVTITCAMLLYLSGLPVTAAVNPIGQQPQGTLSGKIVYVNAGHGYTAGDWEFPPWNLQRPVLHYMNEDLNNQDAMTFLVEYLWKAGATVVPLRPVGHQLLEIVIDNDDPEVEFVGAWSDGSSSVFFGDPGDTPYRVAATSATETAYARYRPVIPESSLWPVYSWIEHGGDRVDQLYRITHAGGTTEVAVDHRKVGNGLVYLGTYYFEQGTVGFVDVSNRNAETGVVIADMIRFGNGLGDVLHEIPGSISGQSREDEAGLYWIEAHSGQGIPESEWRVVGYEYDHTATVSAPSRWAKQMNREASGVMTDRVYVSYHANSSGGAARGTIALVNASLPTPNQLALSTLVAAEIEDDMVALAGMFEHDWYDRVSHTFSGSFGEISNGHIGSEFDATIIERAFNDNQLDAELLRDPKVCTMVARATYQALVRYFNQFDGGATPLTFLPDPVTDFRATSNGDGTITLAWSAPVVDGIGGEAATGYRIYVSKNGRGFDGGTAIVGGATTSHTMSGLDPADGPHYFKVVATNEAGESLGSSVLAATPLGAPSTVLIVNGYDQVARFGNVIQALHGYPHDGHWVERVRPRYQNSGDYAIQVAEAIEDYDAYLGIDSADNEPVIQGDVLLGDYETVVWILGLESTDEHTFDTVEQGLVASFVAGGGDLFVSGSEIGFDLDSQGNGASFYNNTLHAEYIADDAVSSSVQGAVGSIFEGLLFDFDPDGSEYYPVRRPDIISPLGGAETALTYVGGLAGGAAIQYMGSGGEGNVVMLAFPFEAILGEQDRASLIAAALGFLGTEPVIGMPVMINDDTPGTATVDGTVNLGEYVGFSIGINSGFGDVIGAGSQLHVDSDADGVLSFGLITGGGGLFDHAVIYIDSHPGGFGDTSSFTDIADPLRAAISATGFLDIAGRADITFPPGFEADFAIGLEADFAGVWELADPAEHTYIVGAPPTTTTSDHWEFAFTLADLDLVPGDFFDYIVTYGNASDANGFYRSDEFHGVEGTTVPAGNIGINPVVLTSGDFNTFHSYSSISSVGEPGSQLATRMLGAFPNPFNPRTELAFELAVPATVSLEVYDLAGRRIRVLVQGVDFATGRHSVLWQGRDEKGSPVSSGVYLYRLRTDDYVETKKMVLLR